MRTADEGRRPIDGESQGCAAYHIERQMGPDIDPGQADSRNGAQDEGPADWVNAGKCGRAQGDGHAGVPGQVPEPGRLATVAADIRKQDRGPGPSHQSLD